jgi:lipoyl(octanoyl) transferase
MTSAASIIDPRRAVTASARFCQIMDLGLLDYTQSLDRQRQLVEKRKQNSISDCLLLVEHPHVITLGRAGKLAHLLADEDLLRQRGVEFLNTDRGGDITYHGPGQLVAYPIMDLTKWHKDVHLFLRALEETIIHLLAEYGISSQRVAGATGVWVGDEKIAAIGVRTSQWVTSHGLALNVNTNLDYFSLIVPCGLTNKGITSMKKLLGQAIPMREVKERFCRHFGAVFDFSMRRCPTSSMTYDQPG